MEIKMLSKLNKNITINLNATKVSQKDTKVHENDTQISKMDA